MIKVNLLSPGKKEVSAAPGDTAVFADEERENKLNIPAIVTALVLSVAVIGLLYFIQSNKLDTVRKTLEEKKATLAEKATILKTLDQLEKTRKMLDRKVKIIQNLNARKQITVKMMDQLSKALPEMVWLTNMKFTNGFLSLSGSALSNNMIADFINNLKSTNYFYNIQFRDSVRKKVTGVDIFNFRLQCSFREITEKKGTI